MKFRQNWRDLRFSCKSESPEARWNQRCTGALKETNQKFTPLQIDREIVHSSGIYGLILEPTVLGLTVWRRFSGPGQSDSLEELRVKAKLTFTRWTVKDLRSIFAMVG